VMAMATGTSGKRGDLSCREGTWKRKSTSGTPMVIGGEQVKKLGTPRAYEHLQVEIFRPGVPGWEMAQGGTAGAGVDEVGIAA